MAARGTAPPTVFHPTPPRIAGGKAADHRGIFSAYTNRGTSDRSEGQRFVAMPRGNLPPAWASLVAEPLHADNAARHALLLGALGSVHGLENQRISAHTFRQRVLSTSRRVRTNSAPLDTLFRAVFALILCCQPARFP